MVKVSERRLGREKALGLAHHDQRLIEIDPRLSPRAWLSTLLHEAVHIAFPDMAEEEVARAEKVIAPILWKAGIRRVHVK